MGWRYHKSINLGGGFRINLSNSGIGYSWGTKGYRISRTARGTVRRTYTIPGTGLSYVDETRDSRSSRNQRSSNRTRSVLRDNYQQQYLTPSYEPVSFPSTIRNDDGSLLFNTKEDSVADAIKRTISLNRIGVIMLLCLLLVGLHPIMILVPIMGLILIIIAHTVGRVSLDYSFDPEKEEEYIRRLDAWGILAEGKKEWQVVSETHNSNLKTHAGAYRNVDRVEVQIEKGHPYYIKTNVDSVQIVLHKKEKLIILPDKVFHISKRDVNMIEYSDFSIDVSTIRFVERGSIPSDAQVIGYTWQYVNKNGTPDLRYKNNQQIPECLYGRVLLRTSSGLKVELQISNVQNARDFAELIP